MNHPTPTHPIFELESIKHNLQYNQNLCFHTQLDWISHGAFMDHYWIG